MKIRKMRFVFLLSGVTVLLLVFLLGSPHRSQSQTPTGSAAPQPPPTGTTPAGPAQPPKGNASSGELEQRLQALNRELEGAEKKLEEFSKLVAQERSRLPSESVLLDQYLFLQSQVQELGTKVEQLHSQPRAAAQKATPDPTPSQPEDSSSFALLRALLLPIVIVLLYDRLFNTRRVAPLEERVEHLEDYAYGKDKGEGDPFKETEKKEEV